MKKLLIFFQLFIIFIMEQKSFSQTLCADSGKQIKITIFCKEIPNDSCMKPKDKQLSKKSHRSIVMGQDAPAFIYPTSEDLYRWVREWQKEFKGVSIQY